MAILYRVKKDLVKFIKEKIMPILDVQINQVGQSGVSPSIIFILTDDTLAEVSASGYLNGIVQKFGIPLSEEMFAVVTTKTAPNATSMQVGTFGIKKLNNNWSLIDTTSLAPNNILLPTTLNHIATYTDANGGLSQDAPVAINNGNIQAGMSGSVGAFTSYPATVGNGSFSFAAANAGGVFNTIISNGAMTQSTLYTIADIGAAFGYIPVTPSPIRIKSASQSGTSALANIFLFDTFCTTTSLVIGNFSAQANPASVLSITPANGAFTLSASAAPGNLTFNYIIIN